nr:immunoglobulin light chain junction region [Macaca mulatta]MOV82794.1 immunoglobulin light chain junction region [Macaca mulatta]MOV84090.1 immunoglobulin light chain junction region [Macaca mulatta]
CQQRNSYPYIYSF